MTYQPPHIIDFGKLGESGIGYLSIAENKDLPFAVERVFWTYYTPESIVRGRHAHYKTEQLLIAVTGRIIVTTDDGNGDIQTFVLDEPNKGVYLPPNVWHTMQYSHTAIQLVFASLAYDANDYIRDYQEFKKIWGV
ncbi:MAG: FdtA/QdtA family cupin domain-containing protein [Bacteroidia bacterium]|nr:FdtA/QdtA family cupin domain-containing protein [Bacteroidia bacterium]MBP9689440.1 FdtA/QdtA family cupin domain-containing protein [Bacteroidia bacterium]